MTTQLRYLASIKQTRRNFTSRHGSLHATTPLCVVKKKRGSNLTSHESLFAKNSHSRVQLSASLPPSNPSNTRKRYTFPFLFLFSSFPSLASNRWSSSTSLPQGLLIEREREDGNEISTLWNSMGWFMTAISHQWRHPAHRLVETLPDPLSLSFPPFHSRTCSFLLLSVLFYGNGERVGIINGEEINCWRAIRRRFVWSATAVHHALTTWIEARVSMRDLGFFFLIVEW